MVGSKKVGSWRDARGMGKWELGEWMGHMEGRGTERNVKVRAWRVEEHISMDCCCLAMRGT